MEPTQERIDAIYREKVLRARATPVEQWLLDGSRLFGMACTITTAGIRHQRPGLAAEEVFVNLRGHLAPRKRLEWSR